MKQVVDIQARSHLLKKNQQKENRYKRLFYRVAFHCLCKGTKKLQLRFIFIKFLKNREILPAMVGQTLFACFAFVRKYRLKHNASPLFLVYYISRAAKLNIEKTTLALFLCYQIINYKNGKR